MEAAEFVKKAKKREDADNRGKSLDAQNLAARTYAPQDEEHILSLPVYDPLSTSVQNPSTGQFYYMPDYDGLDEVPLS